MANDAEDRALLRIRAELDRRGWSQRLLSDRTLLGESTVFRLLKGEYTTRTLRKVEQALGLEPLEGAGARPVTVADIRYGGYLRELYGYYEGPYACLRPSFTDAGRIAVHPFSIAWSDAERALVFEDSSRGYEQKGVVAMPIGAAFLHFLTLANGSARLITAYHAPPAERVIRGLSLTLANPRGRDLLPAAAPLLLVRMAQGSALAGLAGLLERSDPRIAAEVRLLDALALAPVLLRS